MGTIELKNNRDLTNEQQVQKKESSIKSLHTIIKKIKADIDALLVPDSTVEELRMVEYKREYLERFKGELAESQKEYRLLLKGGCGLS